MIFHPFFLKNYGECMILSTIISTKEWFLVYGEKVE